MRYSFGLAFVVLFGCFGPVAAQQASHGYSSTVVGKCTNDATRLCPEHALGSTEMRYCMEAKVRHISKDCMTALEDDGIVPRGSRNKSAQSK